MTIVQPAWPLTLQEKKKHKKSKDKDKRSERKGKGGQTREAAYHSTRLQLRSTGCKLIGFLNSTGKKRAPIQQQ